MEEIIWKTTGKDGIIIDPRKSQAYYSKLDIDDFIAYYEGYILRVERMSNRVWWFQCYINHSDASNPDRGEIELCDVTGASNMYEAMAKSELAMCRDIIDSDDV